VNATITLVPKKKNPATMSDYRPISCCNLIYKCITKILANRLLLGLDNIISSNQEAFISKRSISENILLAQELVCDYHKKKDKPQLSQEERQTSMYFEGGSNESIQLYKLGIHSALPALFRCSSQFCGLD
jgi:hypothetical protein